MAYCDDGGGKRKFSWREFFRDEWRDIRQMLCWHSYGEWRANGVYVPITGSQRFRRHHRYCGRCGKADIMHEEL